MARGAVHIFAPSEHGVNVSKPRYQQTPSTGAFFRIYEKKMKKKVKKKVCEVKAGRL